MVLKYVHAGAIGFSLLASAVLGINYLIATERDAHLRWIEKSQVYRAQEKEQEKHELNQLGQELMESWRDKHRIPGLEYVLRNTSLK